MPGIRDRLRLWRLTIASVYIYAGLSRVGPGVADEMSLRVLQTILSAVSAEHGMRNDHFVFAACLTMSVSEILVGVLLLWRRFRRGGVIASVGLHLTLLAVLGPWGLKQQAGVLLWNLYFLLAVPALFWSTPNASQLPREEGGAAPKTSRSASFFAAFVVLAPLSGLFSMADNWPSWQLYSPRPEVIRVFVRQDSVNQLPLSAQEFVMPPLPLDVWCPVRIDLWSLRATGSPIYPEDRFQLAIAGYLMRSVPVDSLRISVESPDRPTWWTRSTQEYSALAQLEALEADFVLNSSTVRLHEP